MPSLATHSRKPYATADYDVGAYEMHDGRAIPRVLAFQLEHHGHKGLFQWRTKPRPTALNAQELKVEQAVLKALKADAKQLPFQQPQKRNNNRVMMR